MKKIVIINIFLFCFNAGFTQKVFDSYMNFLLYPDSVEHLVLHSCHIDSLKNQLPKLVNLKSLRIENENEDTIEIPESIYKLETLEYLKISAKFHKLSPEIKNLNKLKYLYLSTPESENPIPKEIKYLTELRTLTILGIDTIIDEICMLENLRQIYFTGNFYFLPKKIGLLKNLTSIEVQSGNLSDLPASLKQLKNLEYLILRDCNLEEISKNFCYLNNLKYLDLTDNRISEVRNCLVRLNKIEKVFLNGNNISDKIKK